MRERERERERARKRWEVRPANRDTSTERGQTVAATETEKDGVVETYTDRHKQEQTQTQS